MQTDLSSRRPAFHRWLEQVQLQAQVRPKGCQEAVSPAQRFKSLFLSGCSKTTGDPGPTGLWEPKVKGQIAQERPF